MNSFKTALIISRVSLLSIKRYRTYSMLEIIFNRYGFKYPAEWVGILFTFSFFAVILTGVAFERSLLINNTEWINIIDVNLFFFFTLIAFEFLMLKPVFNIGQFNLKVFPISSSRIVRVKYLYEIFDKKIIGLFIFYVIFFIFFLNYELKFDFGLCLITIMAILMTYFLACSIIVLFKNFFYKIIRNNTNFFFSIIATIILAIVSFYIHYIKFQEISNMQIAAAFFYSVTACLILYLINLYIEVKR